MQPGDTGSTSTDTHLRGFLEAGLPPRGQDPVTARSDLWAHAHIAPVLRDAALNLQGSDIYKKVKPPGDTTLYSGGDWLLAPVADKVSSSNPAPQQLSSSQFSAAFALPQGRHVLPEEMKGKRVVPPNRQQQQQPTGS